MILDRITITGADDSICPSRLVWLSDQFPISVEWGILVSRDKQGVPRYPSMSWIQELQKVTSTRRLKLSLHVCGAWTRHLLIGVNGVPSWLFNGFERVQLNFRVKSTQCDTCGLHLCLTEIEQKATKRQFIFQIDSTGVNQYFTDLKALCATLRAPIDAVPLFDISGGRGITPETWPSPPCDGLCGYAGGLGPDNLAKNLELLSSVTEGHQIWVDMESKVRSNNDSQFDLDKVKECLNIAANYAKTSVML